MKQAWMKQTGMALALLIAGLVNKGIAQSKPQQVEGSNWRALTGSAPAVTTDGTNRYIAWQGLNNDVYFAMFNGKTWTNHQIVGGTGWTAETSATPAILYAGFGTTVWLAWKGKGSSNTIWFSTGDGTSWSKQEPVSGTDPDWTAESNAGPALGIYGGTPYVAWKGASTDEIWYTYNLGSWAHQQVISGSGWTAYTKATPAVTTDQSGNLHVFWKGKSSDDIWGSMGQIVSCCEPEWLGQGTISCSAESNVAPGAGFFTNANKVLWDEVVFWKQSTSNAILYSYGCGKVAGSSWTAQTNVTPAVANYSGEGESVASILAWKNASDNTVWFLDPTTLPSMKDFAP
jgi:hypothetical protein